MRQYSSVYASICATLIAGGLLVCSNPGAVLAAVRVCLPHVTSSVIKDRSEQNAKRRALLDWVEKAKKAGIEHPSWRIANSKVLKCVSRNGFHECVAHGAPCTIKQKAPPPTKPPGSEDVEV
ncbi:MAG: hypothetical protein KJ622_05195 [Alphaproteobacteria bacterium]|nr:hypothetical protein [Alphaproteobacteria bacterium]